MKVQNYFVPLLLIVVIIRLYKLLHNFNHISSYGVYNISTFATYVLAIVFMIIFSKNNKFKVAASLLIVSIALEYVFILYFPSQNAYVILSIVAVLASICLLGQMMILRLSKKD